MEEKSRRAWRIPIVVGLVLLAAVVALLIHRSSSQGQLQRYIAELRAKGEKLTFAELNVSPPPPGTNSTKAFFQATAQLKTTVLAPYTVSARDFVKSGQARVRWREPLPAPDVPTFPPPPRQVGSPGTVTWAQLRTQFESNQVALDAIRDAMRNPSPSSGTVPALAGPPVNNFVSLRMAAQWLSAATIVDLQEGSNDSAIADLEALGGMVRLNSEDFLLVSQMIRVAIGGLGLATTWELLQRPDLDDAQLQRVAAVWQDVDFLQGLERAFVGERALGNQFWNKIQGSSATQVRSLLNNASSTKQPLQSILEDFVALPAYRLTSMDDDHLFYLHCMQDNLDAARAMRRGQAWLKSKPGFDNSIAEIQRIAGTPQRLKYWVTLIVIPNIAKASDTVVRTETERRMTLTSIALQRYRLRFGKFPENLEALVPRFLVSVPKDCMNGQSLSYHLKSDGNFTLYSVGSNGLDDGGDPSAPPKTNLSFWSGKDAVWPAAAN